jgi:pimeloyl-ACP methyl ester carboxylesterase
MPTFPRDGLSFHYRDRNAGADVAFVFQHGLGSDSAQPFGLYTPPPHLRLLSLDCRAHGETRPLGDPKKVSLAPMADDVVALLDTLGIDRAVVGGISMGAAVALNMALRYPDRVLGLVLARPAWLDRPLPHNARSFAHVAQYLLKFGATEGLERFRASAEHALLLSESPDAASALERQFLDPRAEECVVRLERIPHDAPAHDRAEWATLDRPALVLGFRHDPIHPWEFAETLAATLPRARLVELTSKSVSLERYAAELQTALDQFLGGFLQGKSR